MKKGRKESGSIVVFRETRETGRVAVKVQIFQDDFIIFVGGRFDYNRLVEWLVDRFV